MTDAFFKPESGANDEEVSARLSEWDGTPRVLMDEESYIYLASFVPHFTGLIAGPHTFGSPPEARAAVACRVILTPDRRMAEMVLWKQARRLCDEAKYPWDEDDWEIAYLQPVNCC
jgi:hypothetical protein